jgi:abequosyltransferase
MLPDGLRVKYLPEPLLSKRGENDSFLDKEIVHRIGIAINGYGKIADTFFGHDSSEARHIRRALRNECWLGGMSGIKIAVAKKGNREEYRTLERMASQIYADAPVLSRLRFFVFRYLPPKVLNVVIANRSRLLKLIKR